MRSIMSAATGLVFMLAASHALATTYYYSGQQCQWYDGSEAGLQYSSYGLANNQGSGQRGAFCPANGYTDSNLVTIESSTVVYYDGSDSMALACAWSATNWDGSLYWGQTLYSCGEYGGCDQPSTDDAYTGIGQLNFPQATGAVLSGVYALNVSVECFVPSGSVIYGYNMTL